MTELKAQLNYPKTKKGKHSDTYHGIRVKDPYRWLEDDTSAATAKWVSEQNKVTHTYLDQIPYLQNLKDRLSSLYNYERYSAPFRKGAYYYFSKNDGLQNQAVLYRQKGLNGTPEVVIDPNKLAADGTSRLTVFEISKDGRYAAWGISKAGSDWQTFHVKDMKTLRDLPDALNWVKFSEAAWQGKGFYYSRYPTPAKGREFSSKNENHQIFYHQVGTPQSADKLVYEDQVNGQRFHTVTTSQDERYTFLEISDRGKGLEGNALFYSDSQWVDQKFRPIIENISKFSYTPQSQTFGNKLLLLTNHLAPNSKVMMVDLTRPAVKNWTTLVPQKKEPLQHISLVGGRMFLSYLKDVSSRIFVHTVDGNFIKELELPGIGTADGFDGEKDDQVTFFTFTSFNFPTTIYKYDIATGQTTPFRKPLIDFNPEDYVTEQQFYPSKDGTRIPMFLIHKKGIIRNSKNPTILYAYGGFNVSLNPSFNVGLIPFLEQGGIYVVANLRGGSEYGEKWHQAGMLLKKQTVFNDFIAAADYLIKKKYTSVSKLAIWGGSNGGLLVGAVINQQPELYKVAIAEVGVMDMLRFHKFTIGWNWTAEYGNSDKARDFRNLYSYSPLHNIKPGLNYPATIITTSDHDDRVVPAHSFKYAATMQEIYKGKNPILLRVETNSGHGSSNITKYIEATAEVYAFTMYNLGMDWQ